MDRMFTNPIRLTALAALTSLLLSSCAERSVDETAISYATEYGLGPDKWATAWLLTRHVTPGSTLKVSTPRGPLPAGIPFDVPLSDIRRSANKSAFEVAKSKFRLDDPVLNEMAGLVYEIEVNYWAGGGPPEADAIEGAYRDLQLRGRRNEVPAECYIAFWDRVYEVLKDSRAKAIPFTGERLDMTCDELSRSVRKESTIVPEVPIVDVISAAAAKRRVVFIDVREEDEYLEGHIPGALNLQLRDVSPELRTRIADADYVVSYCVKDFRGFEMAKALADIGVPNSVIMRPYGIKGWVALGLPITGNSQESQAHAETALASCYENVEECLKTESSI